MTTTKYTPHTATTKYTEYCIDVITAKHLSAGDCRRRAFAIFAIARAGDHQELHRIAAAAGFLVPTYNCLSNRSFIVQLTFHGLF